MTKEKHWLINSSYFAQKINSNMENKILKVAIIEDLVEVALSLQTIINSQADMVCHHVYHNAEDALIFLPTHQPDIVIVDIGLPRASGITVISKLSVEFSAMLFCMFTVYEDDEKIFQSMNAGAKGYILKGASKERIINSIHELHEGGSPMTPSIARRIIDIFSAMTLSSAKVVLPITTRELELLTLLSKGLLYKEIGVKMGITTGTVKQHIYKIYEKLHVSNRTEAINKFNDSQKSLYLLNAC